MRDGIEEESEARHEETVGDVEMPLRQLRVVQGGSRWFIMRQGPIYTHSFGIEDVGK